MRSLIHQDPFISLNRGKPWREIGLWPCSWVDCPTVAALPFVTAYRLRVTFASAARVRLHVTADERYELFLDGQRVGRGPERGAPHHWFYETYEFDFSAGDHMLVARVWSLGDQHAGIAQMSAHPGFLLAAEGKWTERLSTGHALWEAKHLTGYSFLSKSPSHWRGSTGQIDGRTYPWGVEEGHGDGWEPVRTLHPGVGRLIDWEFYQQHVLYPAMVLRSNKSPPLVQLVIFRLFSAPT